jgi:hypothetical protein
MLRFFKLKPRPGAPLSMAGIAEGLAKIEYALVNMRVENGCVDWSQLGAPTICFGDDGHGSTPGGLTGGMPTGGDEYQVLQRDSDGAAVWDWLRVSVPEEE